MFEGLSNMFPEIQIIQKLDHFYVISKLYDLFYPWSRSVKNFVVEFLEKVSSQAKPDAALSNEHKRDNEI